LSDLLMGLQRRQPQRPQKGGAQKGEGAAEEAADGEKALEDPAAAFPANGSVGCNLAVMNNRLLSSAGIWLILLA